MNLIYCNQNLELQNYILEIVNHDACAPKKFFILGILFKISTCKTETNIFYGVIFYL